jgi:Na+/H+-dicarboxylate symporter
MVMPPSDFVKQLGPIRHQLLSFVLLGCVFFVGVGTPLINAKHPARMCLGFLLYTLSFLLFIACAIFYAFATFYLPRTQQELTFAESAEEAIDEHVKKAA